MRPILLTGFAGAALDPNPRLLDERVGTMVIDARPSRGGDLRPLKLPLAVASVPGGTQRQTIYRMGRDTPTDANYWLSWTTEVSVARAFDGVDTTERIYYTGDGAPKWTNNVIGLGGGPPYPQASRALSVPTPVGAITAVMDTDGVSGDEAVEFYTYTFVNDLGWESAPAPPSTGLLMHPGAIVDLSTIDASPGGTYGVDRVRIYKTQTGTSGVANFYFLREIAIGTTTSEDDARTLGYLMVTTGWLPLLDTAHHLLYLWNGMFAALNAHTLHFSVPNQPPYAWPVDFDRIIDDTPVALAKWEQNLLVLTTGAPKLFNGQEPAGMSESGAAIAYSCVASKSVVSFEHGVVWASSEGLAYAGNGGNKLLTQGVLTPDQWKALAPSTMIAGRWGRLYTCSFNDGGGSLRGFMFDPLAPEMGIWFLSYGWNACWYDPLQDNLYILQGVNIKSFDDGLAGTCSFTSKKFLQRGPRNFPRAKVTADAYPARLKVYADNVLVDNKVVPSARPYTIGPESAEQWQLEISEVTASVQAVGLGDIDDFKDV